MKSIARRLGATVAGGALAATALSGASLAPAQADEPAGVPTPTTAAADWLAAQLNDNNLLGADSVSATLDLGIGLARTSVAPDVAARVKTGLDGALAAYVGTAGEAAKAGGTAKAAVYYTLAGDPTNAAGIDLIERLEAVIDGTGQLASPWGVDLFNQGSAVFALDDAGSPEAAAATDFLLAGQCDGAGWGYEVEGTCISETDTTALAISGLAPQRDDVDVAAAIADGVAWLKTQQAADGSLGLTDYTPYNVNSTGLVAWAFAEAGDDAAAAKAAAWVRAHQLTGSACDLALGTEEGAITYSDEALASDLPFGLADINETTLATAQAFPALTLAPAAVGTLKVTAPAFVQAGKAAKVTVTGVAKGERVCVAAGTARRALTGTGTTATLNLTPAKTAKQVTVTALGRSAFAPSVVLSAKKLKPAVKATVKRGAKQKVTVSGLAAGEQVTVKIGKKKVAGGKANGKGVFTKKFKVTAKRGKATVTVTGQFANRKGTKRFRVK